MNIIGVIGPETSLKKIHDITNEFDHKINFIDFPYNDAKEVKDIIIKHRAEVNGWFLSGPIPYHIAKKVLNENDNFTYCAPVGPSLYRCLLRLALEQHDLNKSFSIDMIESENFYLQESLEEIGIPIEKVYIKKFDENYQSDEIVQYHFDLWRAGKISGILTVLQSVYDELKQLNAPVYKISMTKMEIRQAAQILIETAKSNFFKESQIGVEIIEINQFNDFFEKSTANYSLQYLELKVKKTLLEFCEKLDGSLTENGDWRYQIFSSRKAIERELETLQSTVQQIKLEVDAEVTIGIGFGTTAVSAENNAKKALLHSKKQSSNSLIIVQEDGTFIETVADKQIAYESRSNDLELIEKLNEANISVKTYRKIEALVHRMGWKEFTSAEIADQLSMSVRNAQRILSNLVEIKLVTLVGEELNTPRGRPRKLYHLN